MTSTARGICVALSFAFTLLAQAPAAKNPSSGRKAAPLSQLPYSPSLDLTSMDRSVDPCADFYHYACGGWIKKNPIPPDQARWDVYSKLQYENELFLWGILEEAAKPAASRTAVQQQIGDYFQSCMNEGGIEKADASALRPALDAIGGLNTIHELAGLVASEHLNGTGTMFGFGSNQDFEDSTRVIAFTFAGGLGLPDRDYYVKDEPKMREIRDKYLAHVTRMFELLGDDAKTSRSEAQTVMIIETALAKSSLTQVDKRDPYKLFHKLTLTQLKALTPSFDWDRYLATTAAPSLSTINVTEPEFYKELERQLVAQSFANWKTYLRWHLTHSKAPYLSSRFVNENFSRGEGQNVGNDETDRKGHGR